MQSSFETLKIRPRESVVSRATFERVASSLEPRCKEKIYRVIEKPAARQGEGWFNGGINFLRGRGWNEIDLGTR